MKLYHYSDRYIDEMEDKTHLRHMEHNNKPRGLWVTPLSEDGWEAWIKAESFRWERYTHITEVEIDPTKVLLIENKEQLEDFSHTFISDHHEPYSFYKGINWDKVKAAYRGILSIPYLYECRWDINWYYTWDCASGCIWGKDAVVSLKPFGMVKYELEPCTGS